MSPVLEPWLKLLWNSWVLLLPINVFVASMSQDGGSEYKAVRTPYNLI
jgi:hypothetical protein